MPGMPVTETSRARCSRAVAWSRSLIERELLVASDEGRLEALGAPDSLALGHHPHRPPGLDGLLLALQGERRRPRLNAIAPEAARQVDSSTSTVPGGADALHPGGGVDRVAEHHALGHLADRDRDLAGDDARRVLQGRHRTRLRARPPTPRRRAAARTARSASSSFAIGAPHTAMTASPMNFSIGPAVMADDAAGALEVEGEELADLLGVAFLGERREADEVDEQHRAQAPLGGRSRRSSPSPSPWPPSPWPPLTGWISAGGADVAKSSVVPHSSQNFASGMTAVPQDGQARVRGLPHSRQNLPPCLLSTPQFAQRIGYLFCSPEGYDAAFPQRLSPPPSLRC